MNYFREQQLPTYLDRWMEYEKDRQYGRMAIVGLAVYLNSIPDSLAQLKRALTPDANGNVTGGVNLYSYASTNTLDSNGIVTTPNSTFYGAIGDYFGGVTPVPEIPWKSKPVRGHVYGWIRVDDGPAWRKDGVAVVIESDTGTDTMRLMFTDATGFFGAVDLPPDRYRVRLLNPALSFVPQDVTAGSAARVDIFLHDSDFASAPNR